ncbi:MAG: hypothetical protein IT381_20095 [Deltaproteobacteria bacterium]|nr:hypothetical protein [Deltaproteobacteria bacterium]
MAAFSLPLQSDSQQTFGAESVHGLFPGDDKALSKKEAVRLQQVVAAVTPIFERLKKPGEHIVCVTPVVRKPTFMESLALGSWTSVYLRSALVFTNKRLIDVALEPVLFSSSSAVASGPVRTLALEAIKTSKRSWLYAMFKLHNKEAIYYSLLLPRKAKKLLWPAIQAALPSGPVGLDDSKAGFVDHCPSCLGELPKAKLTACSHCQAELRTQAKGALLALAFPGAGAWYAGRNKLAATQFFIELALVGVVATLIFALHAPLAEVAMLAAVIVFFAKRQAAHVAYQLLKRPLVAEGPRRNPQGTLLIGGAASALVAAGLGFFAYTQSIEQDGFAKDLAAAQTAYDNEKYDEALEPLNKAHARLGNVEDKKRLELFLLEAKNARAKQDFQVANQAYTDAVAVQKEILDSAEPQDKKAQKLALANLHYDQADLLRRNDQKLVSKQSYQAALTTVEKDTTVEAIELKGNSHYFLGDIALGQKDFKVALSEYEQAFADLTAAEKPDGALESHRQAALTLADLGEMKRALSEFNGVMKAAATLELEAEYKETLAGELKWLQKENAKAAPAKQAKQSKGKKKQAKR